MIDVKGAGGGLIKSHYCPHWWILFICLFVGFLLFLALGVAVQVIYVPLFSLILVLMLFYINVSLCFHCFTFNCVVLFLTCCFFLFCIKSSLGRGSTGSSYLLAQTTWLVPNAEPGTYLYLLFVILLPLFLLLSVFYLMLFLI